MSTNRAGNTVSIAMNDAMSALPAMKPSSCTPWKSVAISA